MGTRRTARRTDLFLVRLSTAEARDDSGQVTWHGTVQRVRDGESHPFSSWQDLANWLMAMVSSKEGR